MYLGGKDSTPSYNSNTQYNLSVEQNKNLRKLNESITCLIAQNKDSILDELLTDIKDILTSISSIGISCDTPSHVKLCDLQAILDKLESIKVQINGDDIQINMNLDEVEPLLKEIRDDLKRHYAQDTFQLTDCSGTPIGSPQEVIKTVVLNNLTSKICNIKDITDPIIAAINNKSHYNNVKQYELTSGQSLTIPANSVHSISYKIFIGAVDIKIGNDTLEYIKGEADMEEADEYIVQEYVFTAKTNSKIKIKTIY